MMDAFLAQRDPELANGHASAQPPMRLEAPVIEHAVTPAERRVLVDADHDASATEGESALHAPKEGAPALNSLQVAEWRAGEEAERAATVTAAETLSPGETAPFLDTRAVAVGAGRSIAEPAAMFRAEREPEAGDGRDERSLSEHERDISPGSRAEE